MKKNLFILLCLLALVLAGCGGEAPAPTTEATVPSLLFQGSAYDPDTEILTVTTLTVEDVAALAEFRSLKTLDAAACEDISLLTQVRAQYPDLEILCTVPLGGAGYPCDSERITVASVTAEELSCALPLMSRLKSLTLTEEVEEGALEILTLAESYPDLTLSFDFTLCGITVNSQAETVDLSGIEIADPASVEAVLEKLPKLHTVEMHHCGIDNETMDAMNRRHEDIQFIWTVRVAGLDLRTDVQSFIPIKHGKVVYDSDLVNLKYCTEMLAIDLGHQIVTKCDWAAYMPKLQFFLCADTPLASIEPLTGLQELKYVEIFITNVKDYSPLLTLPALEDLNICWTYGDAEIIAQMPYLKRLWWAGKWFRPEERELIESSLPDTLLNLDNGESTGAGWRQHDNYYEMRDLLGMHYMG